MSQEVELHCRCGEIHGLLRDVSPRSVNRMICYCDDCQAALHWLDRADLLDAHGGTDIVQVAPASLSLDRGTERIACMRLSEKGLYRWYASCCKTPLGNMPKPSLPFVGITHELLRGHPDTKLDEVFGPPRAAVLGKYAIGGNPESSTATNVRMIAHAIRRVIGWKLGGKTWPHPFFDRKTGKPNRPVTTLSPADRDALRPKCGPNPTA
jgi:hypothetical protein